MFFIFMLLIYHFISLCIFFLRHALFSFLMQHLEIIYSRIIYIQFYSTPEISPETLHLNFNFSLISRNFEIFSEKN